MVPQFLCNLLSNAPTPRPRAGIRIVRCSALDVEKRSAVLTIGLIINTLLDAHILERSLSKLIACKFPRAGARLVVTKGVYEFHIPGTFDLDTPAVGFTGAQYN
ncbi:hypothetical protein B0H19DRAFT_1259429 [Mycena capillaripes]|nr:hypothetical protein B0H19DRAFT_1259429 [Mycena capillaripes]